MCMPFDLKDIMITEKWPLIDVIGLVLASNGHILYFIR